MKNLACSLLLLAALALPAFAQQEFMLYDTTATDTFEFWLRTPFNYNPVHPPAILVWWHGYGAFSNELRDGTPHYLPYLDTLGWIGVSMRGPFDGKHYQGSRGQAQAHRMLDWAMQTAPFNTDSIYMGGSSMGAAAGQVWQNNHCGIHDYAPAAVVGGSPILDCHLRQSQYVDSGHTLDAMRAIFGGFPWDSPHIAFEYHRASAVHLSDTLTSMHFNALHLPVYNTWGTSDSCWSCEWFAYGHPAQHLDSLRRQEFADTTLTICSGINGHGYNVLVADSMFNFFKSFSRNRYPANISINADENDEYYWTRATLADSADQFGRYGVSRDFGHRRLDINVVRNISALDVEFMFPWPVFDSLSGEWANHDATAVPVVNLMMTTVPRVTEVRDLDGNPPVWHWDLDTLRVALMHNSRYTVIFSPQGAGEPSSNVPAAFRLMAAYPNPFNGQVSLDIESPRAARREIRLYDITGRIARTMMVELQPGNQRVAVSGEGLASGVYFVTMPNVGQKPMKIVLIR